MFTFEEADVKDKQSVNIKLCQLLKNKQQKL